MSYKDKALCKVRTITTFICLNKNKKNWKQEIIAATKLCFDLSKDIQNKGYIVQSIRIVTNPFGEYLNTDDYKSAQQDLGILSTLLQSLNTSDLRVRFAIGEARTHQEIAMLPELIKEYGDLCNACVNIKQNDFGVLNNELIEQSASTVVKISEITERGEGNFNFTVNFNCNPLIPYFPAGYHQNELGRRFVIGLETPDLLLDVLKDYKEKTNISSKTHAELFKSYYDVMQQALQHHIHEIQGIVNKSSIDKSFKFSGFDSSAAPSKDCASLVDIYEQMGVEYFGASGTVEASSLLTKVFKSITNTELVGFSGLMLALTEDTGLARGTENDHFDIRSLLTYSSVCGIGLDTVPIPGNTSVQKISALMRDTGTMAFRLNKPLTVRLFPVPNLVAGERTAFESSDLCNCIVLKVP